VQGTTIDFGTRALQGELPENFKVGWQIYGKGNEMKGIINHEPFGERFHATFPNTGEFVVKAMVPGVAKNESFLFINSLGKVAKGAELLHPSNWDSVVLILLFGVTMFISQKLSLPKQKPAGELDDAQLAQQQSMKIMPFAVTGMFFFIPLPTGVYLYMVISNVVQSLQTFLVMKQPVPEFVNVMDDTQTASAPSKSGSTSESKGKNSGIIKELSHKTGQPAIEPGNKEKSSADKKVVLGEAHILRADNGGGEILNIADANGDSLSEKRKKKKK
jgi:YidC/Oxa1 family membrane protein insertase